MISSLLRVAGQPALAGAQQLVDLVGRDPVVLGVVEHRQQDVQLAQRVGEAQLALQHEPYVAASRPTPGTARPAAPARPSTGPAERLEQPPHQLGAAAGGQRGHLDRAAAAAAPASSGRALHCPLQGAAEHAAQRDGEQRGGRVRAVVDVLRERGVGRAAPALALAAPDQRDGVHLQQQRRRAALGVGLGVEDVRRAVRGGERLRLVGVLVQQEAQVGRGTLGGAGGGDRQEHPSEYCPRGRS